MPTEQELSDLYSNCSWTWTNMNGVKGCVIKGRGAYASASIFLPFVGWGDGTSLYAAGVNGLYWSSVCYEGMESKYTKAYGISFGSAAPYTGPGYRFYGEPVRPVQGFTE